MKNNEYNHVKVNNEGPSSFKEFTSTQGAEYTFHPENKTPTKDELNSGNKTINDSVELNVTPKSRKEGKIDFKKIKDGTTHLASSAGHAVVAATTVSVAVVATVVGVSVIPETQQTELVTFLSSEITTNSIDFSFSFPSKLLTYEETEETQEKS